MYVAGNIGNYSNRIHQLPISVAEVDSFITEGNSYLGAAAINLSGRWERELRLKKYQLTHNGSYLNIPQLFSGFANYDAAVLSRSPLIYFPQRELTGTTAIDLSNNRYNGTYTNVTLNSTGWVNGNVVPFYNNSSNRLNFNFTGVQSGFNGDSGHFSTWIKVSGSGTWTDGVGRNIFAITTDSGSSFQLLKHSVNNTLRLFRSSQSSTVDLQFTTRALGWFNIQVAWASNSAVRLYYDGVQVLEDTTNISGWLGTINIAQLGTFSNAYQGYMGPTTIYSSTQSSGFISTLATVPNRTINMMNLLICDGDSLTQGSQNGATPYPTILQDSLNPEYWDMRNFGVAGQTLVNMLSDVTSQVDTWYNSLRPKKTVICWGGTNDIVGGSSAIAVQSGIGSYCSGRKAMGFSVVVCNILTRAGFGGSQQTIRTGVNTWLASNFSGFADQMVDLAADARLSDFTNTTYFNADQTHLTTTGYGVVAELIKPKIDLI